MKSCHLARMFCHMPDVTLHESLRKALDYLHEQSHASSRDERPRAPELGDPKSELVFVEVLTQDIKSSKRVPRLGVHEGILTLHGRERPESVEIGGLSAYLPELPAGVIGKLADKLDVEEREILVVTGIAKRTFDRRQARREPLAADEADRVLRVARVASEAERVFGDPAKARRWFSKENPVLGTTPLSLLSTDAGSREVEEELARIDWGDFA